MKEALEAALVRIETLEAREEVAPPLPPALDDATHERLVALEEGLSEERAHGKLVRDRIGGFDK